MRWNPSLSYNFWPDVEFSSWFRYLDSQASLSALHILNFQRYLKQPTGSSMIFFVYQNYRKCINVSSTNNVDNGKEDIACDHSANITKVIHQVLSCLSGIYQCLHINILPLLTMTSKYAVFLKKLLNPCCFTTVQRLT